MGIRSVSAATAAVVLLCATASSSPEPAKSKSSGVASYGSLPMAFEPNKGQADPSVAFLARGSGYAVLLRPTDATIVLTRARSRETGSKSGLWSSAKVSTSAFRMTLVGASEVAGTGVERLPGTVNHLIGNDPGKWITGIETFRSARFSQVYAGVDVVYYGTNRNLQYDFIVRPGSSPETIRLAFEGAAIKRIESGELEVAAGDAAVRFSKPVAYQETGGQRTPVAAEWNVLATKEGTPQAAFSIGDFDRTKPLIIDPLLWYSTYLGGSLNDDCLDIDLSQIGEAFVTGGTSSVDFWTLPHVFQPVFAGGNMDAFVTKFDVVGGWTMYSTYLGTQMDDIAFSIRVDRNGQAHVCGFTDSPAFPVTPGCAFPIFSGQRDAFAAILDPIGATLVYSTYIGGGGNDEAREIRLTGRGPSFAVAGGTDSQNYPVTPTAFDPTYNGSIDVTYTEILPLGQGAADLWYSTYIGAMDAEQALCMDVDPKGVAYIGGLVSSPQFPISLNPFQPWYAGNTDGFVFVLDPTVPGPAGMLYSSFIGGKDVDEVRGIVFDPFMAMCSVTGMTKSPDFPVIMGAMQLANAGGSDAFVSTIRPLNAGPLDLFVSTYIGGTADDFGNDIDVDNMEPWIVGTTRSPDFPVTAGCIQPLLNGPSDAFIVRMVPLLNFPVYSTYWGGESDEDGWGIRLDTDANAYACGTTWSQAYPTSAPIPCFDPTYNGWADGWVAKLGIGRATDTTVLPATGRIAEAVTLQAQLTYCYNNSPVIGKQMDFDIDGTYMGSAPTDSFGWATFVWIIDEGAGAGARQIRARFAGDATAGPSFGLNTLTVNLAPTWVYVPNRTGTITESVELRAWLYRTADNAPVVGRSITFKIDGTTVGSGITSVTGRAIYNWVITAGNPTRTITGDFAGDWAYIASSGTGTLTCQSWATKMWGVDRRGKITSYQVFRAWLARLDNTPVVGKTVTFSLDGTVLGTDTTIYTGRAQIGYTVASGSGAGTRTILAQWAGDAGYSASSCTNTLTVDKADPYIWVHPRKVPLGGVANLYAYFRRLKDYLPQSGKTVDFKIDGTVVQTVVTDAFGIARYLYTTVEPVGPHTIRCEFYGDAWVAAGYGEAPLTIY